MFDFDDGVDNISESMNYEDNNEEHVFDTYDDILDEEDFFKMEKGNEELDDLVEELIEESENESDATGGTDVLDYLGLGLAFGDEISKTTKKDFDLDENTDEENFKVAEELGSLKSRHNSSKKSSLRPFEKYVNQFCTGKKSLFDFD